MTDKLRFAPLVRVSTEKQNKKGESLSVQTEQLAEAIKSLGGTAPHWYKGQEHSTPEYERKILEGLIEDAKAQKFDAVMVADLSRWSRDNYRSKTDLKILKSSGIRFFVRSQEYDLFDPMQAFMVGMNVEVAEFFARQQTYKSQLSRIARASRGLPTAGKLPYGRIFDRKTGTWGIDKEKQEKIRWSTEQYLKGERLPKLAKTLGMNASTLWKILTRRSGDTWEIEFRSKQHAIDEKVTMKIPPLLSPETIKRIHAKAEANKTYTHGVIKYKYLLSRAVFCSKCGYAMFGQTNHNGKRYYRHIQKGLRQRKCDPNPSLWVRADELEQAVLIRLFSTLGDATGMEAAMLKAIPDRTKIKELRERKRFLESEFSKVGLKKDRLIDSIADGLISKEESKIKMTDIRLRESSIKAEIEVIDPQLSEVPTEEEIKRKAKMIQRIVGQIYRTPSRLAKMGFEERRKLVSTFFAGKDTQGRRLGVYIDRTKDGSLKYEIRGAFNQTFKGALTPDGLDILDYRDVNVEHLEELKAAVRGKGGKNQDSSGQCHAYYSLGLYQR